MADTSIEWATKVWNPLRGCSIVSAGCRSCYAMKQAHRFAGPGGKYEGLTKMSGGGPVWTGEVRVVPEMLEAPLHWKKPQRVFVNSMSDLFHEDVPDSFIDQVFAVMALCSQHTFQVLTKRPQRAEDYLRSQATLNGIGDSIRRRSPTPAMSIAEAMRAFGIEVDPISRWWPLRNVWLGVSVEDQATADERIPLLLETPAAVRWVSAEPLLAAVTLRLWLPFTTRGRGGDHREKGGLDWVVVGGESGPGARPFDIAWARSTVEQCKAAGVPVFVKQLGAKPLERQPSLDKGFAGRDLLDVMTRPRPPQMDGWGRITTETETFYQRHLDLNDRKGGDIDEWPADLRVREWPEVRS